MCCIPLVSDGRSASTTPYAAMRTASSVHSRIIQCPEHIVRGLLWDDPGNQDGQRSAQDLGCRCGVQQFQHRGTHPLLDPGHVPEYPAAGFPPKVPPLGGKPARALWSLADGPQCMASKVHAVDETNTKRTTSGTVAVVPWRISNTTANERQWRLFVAVGRQAASARHTGQKDFDRGNFRAIARQNPPAGGRTESQGDDAIVFKQHISTYRRLSST